MKFLSFLILRRYSEGKREETNGEVRREETDGRGKRNDRERETERKR